MLMNEIEIVNLADDLKFLPEVSEWIWKEWAEQKRNRVMTSI